MKQVIRFGAYGIVLSDSKILLTQKKSGPYKGLWDLPGGGIEFGETPEYALKRELLEESAIDVFQLELAGTATAVGSYKDDCKLYDFHHVGIIYRIINWSERPDLVPQEENLWSKLNELNLDELTPFAKQVVVSLN